MYFGLRLLLLACAFCVLVCACCVLACACCFWPALSVFWLALAAFLPSRQALKGGGVAGKRAVAAGIAAFVSFLGALVQILRQIGEKAETCRKAKNCFFKIYDKFGKSVKVVVKFTCLGGLRCAFSRLFSVPAAHDPEMMHPIYDKNAKNDKFDVNLENGALAFTSNSSKFIDLS